LDITRHLKGHDWDLIPRIEVEEAVADVRVRWGCKPIMAKLLTMPDGSTKFRKGTVNVCGVSMLPHTLSGENVTFCPNSTPECRAYCILTSGRGACSTVHNGRGWKTSLLFDYPNAWFTMFHNEVRLAAKQFDALRCRPNIFTDVHWEKLLPEDFWTEFKQVRFQDYTKGWQRGFRTPLPRNYRLVYSASERTSIERIYQRVVEDRQRVTVVFDVHKKVPFPKRWHGMRLVDGDVDDDLWSRPAGAVVGLRAKGRLRKADSPFKRSL
jgi:hypothetical protein